MELKEPRKKRLNRGQSLAAQSYSPLPILIEDLSGIPASTSLWPTYVGTFNGDSVIISNNDGNFSLYNMGFFGKGCYSRGFPCFENNKFGIPPVLQKRQWEKRRMWIDELTSSPMKGKTNEIETKDCTTKEGSSYSSRENKPDEAEVVDIEVDEIEISDEESEKSKDSDDRKRLSENRIDSQSNKRIRLSNEPQHQEITIDSSPQSVEMEDTFINSKDVSPVKENIKSPDNDFLSQISDSVIVINDVDFDKCESLMKNLQPRLHKESIKTVSETLNLSLEEAFFLSYALGCLQVTNFSGKCMTLTEMWTTFKEVKPNFLSTYVAYHHFRSKGWVVKSGLKYGGEFLLYKKGPIFYHASYIVIVEDVHKPETESVIPKRAMDWTKLITLQRIAETVSKDVLICHIQWPAEASSDIFDTPEAVSQFKIQEVVYRRWNSNKKDVKEEDCYDN